MSDIAQKLTERRANVWEQMKSLAERAVEEKRNLSAEEQGQLDAMNAEIDDLDKRIQGFIDADKRAKEMESHFINDPKGEARQKAETSEFAKWAREARSGDAFDLKAPTASEKRAMAATGGVGPDGVYGQLWQYAVASSQILEGATMLNTADGNTLPLPVATVHSALGTDPTDANAALTESDSTLTTVDLSTSKYGFITLVPNELIADASFDLEGYIAENAGRQAGIRVGTVATAAAVAGFTTAGVTAPDGVVSNLGDQTAVGQGSDLLVQLYHSVLPEYRAMAGAGWALNDASAAAVRMLKGSDGSPVWQPALTAGDPDLVLGKPVRIVPGLDSFAASKKPIYFGDFSKLIVRIAGGIRFERSNEYAFGNDQAAFRCVVRTGAVVVDPNAVKYLATPAA